MNSKQRGPSGFGRNLSTLMSGAILAQLIPVAIIPVLTRSYGPEDFGLLALYSAILSILSVVATGRYELAIMLPDKDEHAAALLQLSILVACLLGAVLLVVVLVLGGAIAAALGSPALEQWLLVLPFLILLLGVAQGLTVWSNRKRNFRHTRNSVVAQSAGQAGLQALLGELKVTGGLMIGQVFGQCLAAFCLLGIKENWRAVTAKSSWGEIVELGKKYSQFPIYGTPGAFANAAASQLPVFILTKFYSAGITGIFSLTFRVLNVPASFVSGALSQVLHQKIVEIQSDAPEKLLGFIVKVVLALSVAFLPVALLAWLWGEPIFVFVFGEQWRAAGSYAAYLVVAAGIRFCVSPVSVVMLLERNVRKGAAWQILYFATLAATLLTFAARPVETLLLAFVVHEVLLYSFYLALILRGSRESPALHPGRET